jgi:hypothetical protein
MARLVMAAAPVLGMAWVSQARTVLVERDLKVDGTQITGGDTWTGTKDFDINPLRRGDVLVVDLNFLDNCVTIADGVFNENEEIYFRFTGKPPGGGLTVHPFDYTWEFTDESGDVLTAPGKITGTGELKASGQAIIVPGQNINARREIDLVNGSSLTFCDIKLTLTVPPSVVQWDPESIEFSVTGGDSASVDQKVSWVAPSGGSYALASNFSTGSVPSGPGTSLEIGHSVTSRTAAISLDGARTLGTLSFKGGAAVSLSNGSGGSLTFDAGGTHPQEHAALHVDNSGSVLHSINVTTTLADHLLINFTDRSANEVFWNGDIGESAAGRSILVRGDGGQRLSLNGTNAYTGGITADGALVELNSPTAQGAVGSRATAVNGGQIDLGHMPTSSHRYAVGAGSMISGSSNQLGALTVGGNLELAPGAIIGFESNGSARPVGTVPGQSYYGVNGPLSENVTIGGGSWRGVIGSAVTNTFHGGTITLQGDAELGALGGRSLTLQRLVDITRDGSKVTVRRGGEVRILQPPGNSGTSWDILGILSFGDFGSFVSANGRMTLRPGGSLAVTDRSGLTITNPSYSDTTGSQLLSGDVFDLFSGPDLANGGIHFDGGHAYVVNSRFGPLTPGFSNPNLGVKGPNTVLRFGGTVENTAGSSGPFGQTVTNFTVQSGGRLTFTDQATFYVTNAESRPRPVLFWGENGGGTVEFEAGFVADPLPGNQSGEATPGLKTGVFFPGVTVVTNHGQNVPHFAFDYATQTPPTAADTWRIATNPHAIGAPVDVFRPMIVQTDVPVEATGTWTSEALITKRGMGSFNLSGTGRLNGAAQSRVVIEQGDWNMLSTENNTIGGFRVSPGGTLNLTGNLKVHRSQNWVNAVEGAFSLGGTPDNPAGQLDLTDTTTEISAEVFELLNEDLRRNLRSGYNGGKWDGRGIVSSTARADPSLGLGYAFSGAMVPAAPVGGGVPDDVVILRLTKFGDADLNGLVGFPDLVALAQNYNTTDGSAFWFTGDFDYDGNVTFADLVKLAQNYGSTRAAPIPGAPAGFYEDWSRAVASVPEPGGAVVVLGVLAGLRRRRVR